MYYRWPEKLFLNLAFHSHLAQEMMNTLEDCIYEEQFKSFSVHKPIFLSGLARSGSTLLLHILMQSQQCATHIYRDMPFILCPTIWKNFAKHFYRQGSVQERFHQDGLTIHFDSEEAFEEVIWKHFFKQCYTDHQIGCLSINDLSEDFQIFLVRHMKKILLNHFVRTERQDIRYLSKNNANISRIPCLTHMFPEGMFVVPIRHPVTQVASLMRQHQNFMMIQKKNTFVKKYMNYLGHYEFGMLFKRIQFNTTQARVKSHPHFLDESFWVHYWCEAYQYLLNLKRGGYPIHFVVYEELCANPEKILHQLFLDLNLKIDRVSEIGTVVKSLPSMGHYSRQYDEAIDIYAQIADTHHVSYV